MVVAFFRLIVQRGFLNIVLIVVWITKSTMFFCFCFLGFNAKAAIFQLYSGDEHEVDDKMNMK